MRYVLILNAALLALSTTMALVMAVVWLMYRANLDLSARVESDIGAIAAVCAAFAVMALALAGSFLGLLRRKSWAVFAVLGAGLVLTLGSRFLFELVANS